MCLNLNITLLAIINLKRQILAHQCPRKLVPYNAGIHDNFQLNLFAVSKL